MDTPMNVYEYCTTPTVGLGSGAAAGVRAIFGDSLPLSAFRFSLFSVSLKKENELLRCDFGSFLCLEAEDRSGLSAQ
ncbi:hypothetical protein E2C01_019009 [Portunus trituberculatus]|uniref:Uncharacterized protein n=1 Tax=Portunus trituberculatus TaxID=210409 RepID=A0A5B7DY09_PORTR|nr:hypothetical protein [Portunus trituberculatus]